MKRGACPAKIRGGATYIKMSTYHVSIIPVSRPLTVYVRSEGPGGGGGLVLELRGPDDELPGAGALDAGILGLVLALGAAD